MFPGDDYLPYRSDPVFDDMAVQSRWQSAREAAMAHMLRVIEGSRWRDNLVLRGSCLLKMWLADAARSPKDIDWVVTPQSLAIDSWEASDMMTGIIACVSTNPSAGLVTIDAHRAVRDPFWTSTYERGDGMRITFPWTAPDLPPGMLQMDFVFGEALWTPAVPTSLPVAGGAPVSLLAAPPELSLAWKLQWLRTDRYPEGKDLYDAALLAERVALPAHLIAWVIRGTVMGGLAERLNQMIRFNAKAKDVEWMRDQIRESVEVGRLDDWKRLKTDLKRLDIDWDEVLREYPWIQGSRSEWQQRLLVALERSFDNTTASLRRSERRFPGRAYPNSDRLRPRDRAEIFDPALIQYAAAYRAGEPVFDDIDAQRRWQNAREAVMAHMLRIVEGSPWRDNLVLRGSCLLTMWLGDAARPPNDIDWVVIPQDLAIDFAEASDMVKGIIDCLSQNPSAGLAKIDANRATGDRIWTYERADGMRITVPWTAPELPPGTLQMDFVFGEALWTPAVLTSLPVAGGAPLSLLAATPELSLAWKLQWLLTDWHAQGRDLYDAAILAERVVLPAHLTECLVRCLKEGDPEPGDLEERLDEMVRRNAGAEDVSSMRRRIQKWAEIDSLDDWQRLETELKSLKVDWDNFLLEYPWVQGSQAEWLQRLLVAMERSARNLNQPDRLGL